MVLVVRWHMCQSEGETCADMNNGKVIIFLGKHIGEWLVTGILEVGELNQAHCVGAETFAEQGFLSLDQI